MLVLHGAYSTHLQIAAALEPILAQGDLYRRLYPESTGMGDSPAHDSIRTTNDLVEHLVERVVGDAPLLVVGHSYRCRLARAIAARRPRQVAGLALICPMTPRAMYPEPHVVVRAEADAIGLVDPSLRDDYAGYFVMHTPSTADRFNAAVAPSIERADPESVGRMMEARTVEPDPDKTPFENPTLILTGSSDSITGYRGAMPDTRCPTNDPNCSPPSSPTDSQPSDSPVWPAVQFRPAFLRRGSRVNGGRIRPVAHWCRVRQRPLGHDPST